MKMDIKNLLLAATVALFAFSTSANAYKSNDNANHKNNKKLWICETNASSGSNESENKADENMANKATSAKAAFEYALKHCRDCTKITCSVESE